MKADIHPKYYTNARVICSCGNSWITGSTLPEIRTDVCSACHPYFTGEQRIVDTAGQVERFMRRVEAAAGSSRPSKRQSRLTARAEREAASRRGPETEDATPEEAENVVAAASGASGETD
jgi:large subunit ribosomal protein L31